MIGLISSKFRLSYFAFFRMCPGASTRAVLHLHLNVELMHHDLNVVTIPVCLWILHRGVGLAWYPARRKSAWYTLMHFRLIKNGIAHAYDVYTV